MELSIPIFLGLSYLGYNMVKEGKVFRDTKQIRSRLSKSDKPSATNIYRSVQNKKNIVINQNIANERYRKSLDTANTNIVPEAYIGCQTNCNFPMTNKINKQSVLPTVAPENQEVSRLKEMNASQLFKLPSIKGKEITSSNLESGGFSNIIKEGFSNISSLTGLPLDTNSTNRVPFFGSKVTQNTDPNRNGSLLENYTGSGKPKKVEVPNMFKPVASSNVFGNQLVQDRSRFVQSNLKTNLLPTPQIKVAPIPALANRAQFKSIEQLRVNPNVSNRSIDPIVGVNASNNVRGILGEVSKNRPDTSFPIGPDRYLKGSTITGPAARENFRQSCNQHISETMYNIQPAASYVPGNIVGLKHENSEEGSKLSSIHRGDHRQSTNKSHGNRNISNNHQKINEISRDSYVLTETERDTTSSMFLQGPSNTQYGEYQQMPDQAKITTKQTNLFSHTGGAASSVSKPMEYEIEYNRVTARPDNNNYIGNASRTNAGDFNTEQYENIEIKSNREVLDDLKNYMLEIQEGSKLSVGAHSVNVRSRDDKLGEITLHGRGLGNEQRNIFTEIENKLNIGETEIRESRSVVDMSDRINPVFIDSLQKNPYNLDITKLK